MLEGPTVSHRQASYARSVCERCHPDQDRADGDDTPLGIRVKRFRREPAAGTRRTSVGLPRGRHGAFAAAAPALETTSAKVRSERRRYAAPVRILPSPRPTPGTSRPRACVGGALPEEAPAEALDDAHHRVQAVVG